MHHKIIGTLILAASMAAGGAGLFMNAMAEQNRLLTATPSDYTASEEESGELLMQDRTEEGQTEEDQTAAAELRSVLSAAPVRAGSFGRHVITAELINGTSLRLRMDIQMWDAAGGTSAYPAYMLSPSGETDSWGIFKQPWLVFGKTATVNYGKLNIESYTSERSSSGDGDRYLEFKGSWEIGGQDLVRLREACGSSFTLYRNFGSYNLEADEPYSSMNVSSVSAGNMENVWKVLNCTHQYVYECSSDDLHIKKCGKCGHIAEEAAHTVVNGKCSLCGKVFTVTGRLVFQLNGRTERRNYELMPGSSAAPESFTGYISPASQTVPASGGDIVFRYTPVSYTVRTAAETIRADYDEAFSIPEISRKGYRFKYYSVSAV